MAIHSRFIGFPSSTHRRAPLLDPAQTASDRRAGRLDQSFWEIDTPRRFVRHAHGEDSASRADRRGQLLSEAERSMNVKNAIVPLSLIFLSLSAAISWAGA